MFLLIPVPLTEWYTATLDFEVLSKDEESSTYFLGVPGGGIFEILPSNERPRPEATDDDAGIRHVGFTVDEFEPTCQELRRRGIEFSRMAAGSAEETQMAFFPDPEGNILQNSPATQAPTLAPDQNRERSHSYASRRASC